MPRQAYGRQAYGRQAYGPAFVLATAALMAGAALAQPEDVPITLEEVMGPEGEQRTAEARMIDPDGMPLGTAALVYTERGMLIQVRLEDVPPGGHGFHIHDVGECAPPDFESAGPHFNPTATEHGFLDEQGGHIGDLPNVFVEDDGVLRVDVLVPGVDLSGTGPNSLIVGDGTALVLHETIDDYTTDPAGHAGNRIACGVIRIPTPETPAPE